MAKKYDLREEEEDKKITVSDVLTVIAMIFVVVVYAYLFLTTLFF